MHPWRTPLCTLKVSNGGIKYAILYENLAWVTETRDNPKAKPNLVADLKKLTQSLHLLNKNN